MPRLAKFCRLLLGFTAISILSKGEVGSKPPCENEYSSASFEAAIEHNLKFDVSNPRNYVDPVLGASNTRKLRRFIEGFSATTPEASPLDRAPAFLYSTKDAFHSAAWFTAKFGKPLAHSYNIGFFYGGGSNSWSPISNEKFISHILKNQDIAVDAVATYAVNNNLDGESFYTAFVKSEDYGVRYYEREIQELKANGYQKATLELPTKDGTKSRMVIWIPPKPLDSQP